MSELVPSDIIEKLAQKHDELIVELDALNARLEQALGCFAKPTEQDAADSCVDEVEEQGATA
ncbi:MAG: hypothetical protein CMJ72_14120 [Planctomycetaceae bacterium]|nr:hypothetical protein [Planctomycetaceae bacterium]HCK41068.1 hypothetical protein [Planctomycetaceae bacterium]|tara:strand:+ start:65 stop:250 length:186 start_codon:yes stop_codon:yes gene_type:complete